MLNAGFRCGVHVDLPRYRTSRHRDFHWTDPTMFPVMVFNLNSHEISFSIHVTSYYITLWIYEISNFLQDGPFILERKRTGKPVGLGHSFLISDTTLIIPWTTLFSNTENDEIFKFPTFLRFLMTREIAFILFPSEFLQISYNF